MTPSFSRRKSRLDRARLVFPDRPAEYNRPIRFRHHANGKDATVQQFLRAVDERRVLGRGVCSDLERILGAACDLIA